jgi:hypothetical protein
VTISHNFAVGEAIDHDRRKSICGFGLGKILGPSAGQPAKTVFTVNGYARMYIDGFLICKIDRRTMTEK